MDNLNESISSSVVTSTSDIVDSRISEVSNIRDSADEINFKRERENHRHELNMVKYGWFGKLFGAEENSSKAITFTLILLILIVWSSIIVISIWRPDIKVVAIDTFNTILPLLTLALGYIFGKQ